jgi:hypothetical protein
MLFNQKHPRWLLGMLLFLLLPDRSPSQDALVILTYPLENQISILVKAIVTQNAITYRYQYSVSSSISSVQRAWDYSVFNVSCFDSLRNAIGWDVGTSMIPSQRVTWTSSDSVYDIFPGGSLGGFSVISRGLPSIKEFYVRGYVDVPAVSAEPDSVVGGLFPENSFHGTTIGPNTSSHPFRPFSFIDSLNSYVSRSRSLNWITTQAAADKYTNYFRTTRSQLQSANISGALSTLQAVLISANADSTSLLTSEAYALIRYNSQYLITQLQP